MLTAWCYRRRTGQSLLKTVGPSFAESILLWKYWIKLSRNKHELMLISCQRIISVFFRASTVVTGATGGRITQSQPMFSVVSWRATFSKLGVSTFAKTSVLSNNNCRLYMGSSRYGQELIISRQQPLARTARYWYGISVCRSARPSARWLCVTRTPAARLTTRLFRNDCTIVYIIKLFPTIR